MPRIQHKRGTSANLASVNPTPLAGELVWDSSENAIKIGDGATAWTSLAYVTATPRSHVHDGGEITTGTVAYARLPVGSTASTVCAGDDARLTDARTPTAHKASHATGGSDALTPGDIGAAPAASPAFTGNATFSASSGVPVTITNTGTGNSFVVNDASGDTTPFVVDAAGNALIGSGTAVGYADYSALTLRNVNGGVITLLNGSGTAYGEIAVTPTATSFKTATSHPIWFGTNNAERMRLTAAGDLGLGPSRTAPASRLDVNGVITVSATSGSAGSYAPSLTFSGDPNTGFGQVSGQSDTASVFTAGHERVRVDSGGRCGIGHATPSDFNQLVSGQHVVVGNGANSPGVTVYSGTGNSGTVAFADGTTTTDQYRGAVSYSHALDAMRIFSGSAERMRIKSTGSVRFVPLSADPASGNEAGDVYYNSSTNKLRVYNGTSWVDLH